MIPSKFKPDIELAFQKSLNWLSAHHQNFSFRYEGENRDQLLLLKPFAEYLLTIDVLRSVGVSEPFLADNMTEAWLETKEGEILLELLTARPDMVDIAGIYANFKRWGFSNVRLERWLAKLWDLESTRSLEMPIWRRIAHFYSFSRLGLTKFNQQLVADSWVASIPEPWTISDATAYAITHEVFYITDFGKLPNQIAPSIRDYIRLWLPAWTRAFIAESNWDLTAELVMVAACLRDTDWVETPLLRLVRSQMDDGFYPAPQGAGRQLVRQHHTPNRMNFVTNYHTSLVGLLATALILYLPSGDVENENKS